MGTKEFLEIIIYSSGGVFISPSVLFGSKNKRALTFRSFLRSNKSLFNSIKTGDDITIYELTNECCVGLFGVSETLFIKQSFSEMGTYERLLRSIVAIELARVVPANSKIININNINYSFFSEAMLLPAKRANVICDPLSAVLIGEDVGSFYVPKLLRNKNISRTLRSFFNHSNSEKNEHNGLSLKENDLMATGKKKSIKSSAIKTDDLISCWRILFEELTEDENQDISTFFSKKELIDMAISLNNSLDEIDYFNSKDAGTKIKYYLLKLLSCEDFQAWDSLAVEIKEQGVLFFGKMGNGTSEEESAKLKLKDIMEYALSDYSKSIELSSQINSLIKKDAPFYSKNCLMSIIKNSLDEDFGKKEIGGYLVMQLKSTLILYFINRSNVLEKHASDIEFIINNDLDIFNSVMLNFVMRNSNP